MSAINNQNQLTGYLQPVIKAGPFKQKVLEEDDYFFDTFYVLGDEVSLPHAQKVFQNYRDNMNSSTEECRSSGSAVSGRIKSSRVLVKMTEGPIERFYLGRLVGRTAEGAAVQFKKLHFSNNDFMMVPLANVHAFSSVPSNKATFEHNQEGCEPPKKKVSWGATKKVKIVYTSSSSCLLDMKTKLESGDSTYGYLVKQSAAKPGRICKYPRMFDRTELFHLQSMQIFMQKLPPLSNSALVKKFNALKSEYSARKEAEAESGEQQPLTRLMKFKLMLFGVELDVRGILRT